MRILNWTSSPNDALTEAVDCLREGGLVAFPTDTLYGLAVDALNDEAVRRLFEAKRRPLSMPVPILIADIAQANDIVESMPQLALRLGSRYWPGPLTVVLRRSPHFESLALAGGDSVALRVPDHPVALGLIRALGRPITGTSANRSGQPAPRTAQEVVDALDADVDIVIDAGPAPLGIESTVVDLTSDPPRLLREGAVSRRELKSATGLSFDTTGEPCA